MHRCQLNLNLIYERAIINLKNSRASSVYKAADKNNFIAFKTESF